MEEETWKIPLYKIYTDDEDLNLITKIIKQISVDKFTKKLPRQNDKKIKYIKL